MFENFTGVLSGLLGICDPFFLDEVDLGQGLGKQQYHFAACTVLPGLLLFVLKTDNN